MRRSTFRPSICLRISATSSSRKLLITGGNPPLGLLALIGLRAAPRPAAVLLVALVGWWAFPRASQGVPRPEVVPPLGEPLPHLEDQVVLPPLEEAQLLRLLPLPER